MDKETLSNYGWIIVVLIVGLLMIMMSTPLSNYLYANIKLTSVQQIMKNKEDTPTVPDECGEEYEIRYVLQEDEHFTSSYPKSYICGSGLRLPSNVEKTNYKFIGWKTNDTETDCQTTIPVNQMGIVTLYPQWQPVTYSISYILNGGTIKNSTLQYTYTSTKPCTLLQDTSGNTLYRKGYKFCGWYTDSSLSTGVQVISGTGDKEVFAKWEKIV